MELDFAELAITITLSVVHFARCENIPSCNGTILESCPGDNIVCNEHNVCVCEAGFSWDGEECTVPNSMSDAVPDSASTHSHGATLVVALVFTLVLLTCALVLIFRKYKLVDYIRQKINIRRNNDVIYEDVMIGQDDPPISP